MRPARFAALLAVLLVVGLSNWAFANDGDPLILGQPNSAVNPTRYSGSWEFSGGIVSASDLQVGNFLPQGSGLLIFKKGQQAKTISGGPADFGGVAVATVQNPAGVWVASAHVDTTVVPHSLTIRLSSPAPIQTIVAYLVFGIG